MVAEEITQPQLCFLDEATSTNTMLKAMAADPDSGAGHGFTLVARSQSAGRGQRGNTWESEPGSNLTLSVLLEPHGIDARQQFAVSEAVAVAAVLTLRRWLPPTQPALIKWPNDIYVANKKIAGILIEHSLSGHAIQWSVCGIGLNVNQRRFVSDAPNPVSLANIVGADTPLGEVLEAFTGHIMQLSAQYLENAAAPLHRLHAIYRSMLWRADGYHPYADMTRGGEPFEGAISAIEPTGHLVLRIPDGTERRFAFKEVAAIL